MTLVDMIKTDANARRVISELNTAELMAAFNLTLTQAKQIQHAVTLLMIKYDCEA